MWRSPLFLSIPLVLLFGVAAWTGAKADEFEEAAGRFEARSLSDDELAEGWIALFDGESLFGWSNEGDADFRVDQGAIHAGTGSDPCLLRTTSQFDDYLLRVDFISDEGTNSGIFLRTSPRPQRPDLDCYELNIADRSISPFPTGSLVAREAVASDHEQLDWQTFEVRVEGDRVAVSLDGESVLDYVDPRPLGRGFIGLQFNSGRIAFGNVFLRPLGTQPLFNGRDLNGWVTYPELDSEFSVDGEGHLQVIGGPGQLETEGRYADFVLQLACRTNGAHLNSGVFFRCIPGERLNGYESQIHNGYVEGDRSRPVDWGTGAIFRRQPARRVMADDGEWFRKTIVAVGPRMAVWINGYPVTDWIDQRPDDPNPRRGRRLDAGSVMLQGHDPTTDLSFDDLRIRELAPRNR